MLQAIWNNRPLQLALGFLMGISFGFFLNRAGVDRYEVILGQLLLTDFTVLKVMGSAVVVGMAGFIVMHRLGWVEYQKTHGSLGATVPGGLLFGVGFGLLGYCPGTMAAALGHGALDALVGGVPGILLGSWLYVISQPVWKRTVEHILPFGDVTFDELFGVARWKAALGCVVLFAALFGALELAGY
ncbi:YeeE/YedE family protein [Oceanidesulfovibrio indonesiensis]|uniref:YeeE/YedE family protein n=1 Tax=Oceanidesulfovibrio indonesiensis TaxID=54767 RepID=A0A7M3MB21_9BACT|nr:YeeE/YedE thiosulfate transporter family protein [Oceanidesulfovibrio indonesiensis]TVM15183.1 YeeE/YedE family protein [Oceanidesulfovibrio indonesiensis]